MPRVGRFLVETGVFSTSFAEDNPFDVKPSAPKAASMGTAMLLRSLSPGMHRFRSRLVEKDPRKPDKTVVIGTARIRVVAR